MFKFFKWVGIFIGAFFEFIAMIIEWAIAGWFITVIIIALVVAWWFGAIN